MSFVENYSNEYGGEITAGDVYSGLPVPSKWEAARFVFDWGLLLVPGGAILSGVRKASYIRKGYKVVKSAPKGGKLTSLERYIVGRPIRTGLFAGGSLGTAAAHPSTNPLYYQITAAGDVGSYVIGQYIDREGRVRTFLPSGQILSGLGGYTSRTGTEARSFSDMNGLGLLKSIGTPTPTPESFTLGASKSRKRTSARRRSRSDSSKPRAPQGWMKRSGPYCSVHRKSHWCKFTRKR